MIRIIIVLPNRLWIVSEWRQGCNSGNGNRLQQNSSMLIQYWFEMQVSSPDSSENPFAAFFCAKDCNG